MMYYSKHYQLVRSTHRDLCVRDRQMANDFRLKHNWTSQRCLAQKSSSGRLDGLQRLTQARWGWSVCEGQGRHLLWLPWNSCLDQVFMRGRACVMPVSFLLVSTDAQPGTQWDFRKQSGGGGGGGRLVGLTLELGQADASDFVISV